MSIERSEVAGLHVLRQGPADVRPPLVIVHGALDRAASFGRVARILSLGDHPLRVVSYDRRGYARSLDAGIGTLEDHVDDLLRVIGDEPALVFGHSMGGVVALAAAQRRPELVHGVFAYEAPTPWEPWWPPHRAPTQDPADEAEAFLRRMVGERVWNRLPAATRAARRAEGPALRADLDALRLGPPYDPQAIRVPVVSCAGTDSADRHRRAAELLAETVPGARSVVVDGAGHGAHLSHPSALAALLLAFWVENR